MSRLAELPCALPVTKVPSDADIDAISKSFEDRLGALESSDFTTDAIWRDLFALTGTTRTFYGASKVSASWVKTSRLAQCHAFKRYASAPRIVRIGEENAWIDAMYSFETTTKPETLCTAILSLVPEPDGTWKIWILRTILDHIPSFGNVDELAPNHETSGLSNGHNGHVEPSHFDCVVVGAGPAGLSTAGRLKSLGVTYVLIDKHENLGDSWKKRYDSARLHTAREYSHLPFDRTFPSTYQEWLTKDDLAKGYRDWATKYEINVWLRTSLESGSWDVEGRRWRLKIRRECEELNITASHIVLAVGSGGRFPLMPEYANADRFHGTITHSASYTSSAAWKGKRGIVVGTANTAHDVAQDMVNASLSSVTMVQRSKTYVLPYEYYKAVQDLSYNANVPTEIADRQGNSVPLAALRLISMRTLNDKALKEPERFDALERAGFNLERYGDIMYQIYEKSGGHYMDVGASKMIADGLIKMKSDAQPTSYTEDGILFSDGSEVKADVIVFATGFVKNTRDTVRDLFGDQVADQVHDFWGVDEEGEVKGAWRPCGHPGLWLHGGSLGTARYFSRFIALQMKADIEGTPFRIFDG